ncbi:UDP-glucose/GDP-mannose dehydrogenase family, NAD binding domain protein [Bernardetia litoralis DSM 6794]|uniref:UDP-glucose/GDP-mannose dehydrogenase family, NAD binding domain protein n=1 Tax=Bernardetia litoralis (strain ATCC 23117 / DSM 6794 / NBRC 15988 / NCIMB 1366 / Fx l1 / Sio-4) TaxID=880071 RepID=I4AIS7_BERLS|nr:UDP-glucose/GDP-mannose dehydrogenase family, NAD-binding domain protein [Bernardetia litoralis]AFM03862.1 UDP-glucose/GDP-mannose dehydrogenase family, NAD binding domain protein [Bernardetia litoralis DSM 6794]
MKSISILGCGWLGLETAKFFVEKGIQVNGSTTSKEKIENLEKKGIKPFHLELNKKNINKFKNNSNEFFKDFFETDICLINIPPPKENKEFYKTQMEFIATHLLKNKKATKKIIFISSTSIYKNTLQLSVSLRTTQLESFEDDVQTLEKANRKDIFEAENVFIQASKTNDLDVVILRAGGLMGGKRIAGKYFTGKKDLNTGQIPVNFIHRQDLINIIYLISEKTDKKSLLIDKKCNKYEVFNVVCPIHPIRQKVYQKNAKEYNFEAPTFKNNNQTSDYKIINSNKLEKILGYEFIYPNPLYFPVES